MTSPIRRIMTAAPKILAAANDPYSDVERAQELLREGVTGYGEQLRPGLLREIGTTLGGLNEIGALRSGAVPVELGNISERYGQQVGAYAKQATMGGVEFGLQARRQRFEEQEAKRRRKAGLLKSIGSVIGAGIGFIPGIGGAAKAATAAAGGSGVGGLE